MGRDTKIIVKKGDINNRRKEDGTYGKIGEASEKDNDTKKKGKEVYLDAENTKAHTAA